MRRSGWCRGASRPGPWPRTGRERAPAEQLTLPEGALDRLDDLASARRREAAQSGQVARHADAFTRVGNTGHVSTAPEIGAYPDGEGGRRGGHPVRFASTGEDVLLPDGVADAGRVPRSGIEQVEAVGHERGDRAAFGGLGARRGPEDRRDVEVGPRDLVVSDGAGPERGGVEGADDHDGPGGTGGRDGRDASAHPGLAHSIPVGDVVVRSCDRRHRRHRRHRPPGLRPSGTSSRPQRGPTDALGLGAVGRNLDEAVPQLVGVGDAVALEQGLDEHVRPTRSVVGFAGAVGPLVGAGCQIDLLGVEPRREVDGWTATPWAVAQRIAASSGEKSANG